MKTKSSSVVKAFAIFMIAVPLAVGTSLVVTKGRNGSLSSHSQAAAYGKPVVPSIDDQRLMLAMHQAGLKGDRSQIPTMIKALQSSSHPLVKKSALLALARLGATEAVPIVDVWVGDEYVKVAKSRLLAEDTANGMVSGQQRSAAKIDRFYHELGLLPRDINTRAALHPARAKQHEASGNIASYALDQLADIVYHGLSNDYMALPGIAQLNFQTDPPSELKMRLAPLPRHDRVLKMTQELAHKKVLTFYEFDEMQLLADEGTDASHAVAAQLRVMDTRRSEYSGEGFDALFRVLHAIGDRSQAPLVEHFKHDSDPAVAQFAEQNYPSIANGIPSLIVAGY